MDYIKLTNRILLGLVMLVPGLFKLWSLIQGNFGVPGFLASLGFPIPTFFAWVLMLCEIVFGIAILASWKLKYTIWPPVVILVVAALTTSLNQASSLLLHLAAAANMLTLAYSKKN